MGVYVRGKAGAVKAVGAVAAPDIGLAQERLGVLHDLLAQAGGGSGHGIVSPGTRGVLAGDHIIAGHITVHAVVGDFVPAGVDAGDGDHIPVVQGEDVGIIGTGAGAHVEGAAGGLDKAIADGHVRLIGHSQILAGHVALHGLVVHLVPAVAGVLQNHHGVPAGGGGQDSGVGAGLGAHAQGVGGHGAHPETGGGGAYHTQSGESGGHHSGTQELTGKGHGTHPTFLYLFSFV